MRELGETDGHRFPVLAELLESTACLANVEVMTLMLPETIDRRLSPAFTSLHLAIGLFVAEEAALS